MKLMHTADIADALGVKPRKASALMCEMRRINLSSANRPIWVVDEKDFCAWVERRKEEPIGSSTKRRKPKLELISSGLLDEHGFLPTKRPNIRR